MKVNLSILIMSLTLALTACDKVTDSNVDEQSNQNSNTQQVNTSNTDVQQNDTQSTNIPTYNVATLSTFTPFIFRDEQGNTIGFDVDILKAIGEHQGFQVNYLVVPWEGIFDTVKTGSHDIISSAVVITPERQQLVDFSDPYIESGRMAVVGDAHKDKTIKELKDLRFVTQSGTSNVPIVETLVSDPKNIDGVDTQYLEIQSVLTGKADVAFDDSRVMQYYVAQHPELHGITYDEYPGDQLGFAVKKGREDLLKKINTGLAQIKSDGTYDKIYEKWFGDSQNTNK